MFQLRASAGIGATTSRRNKRREKIARCRATRTAEPCQTQTLPRIVLKLDSNGLALRHRGLEKCFRSKSECARQQVRGKRSDLRIEVAHHGVVVPPRILDIVFQAVERILQ